MDEQKAPPTPPGWYPDPKMAGTQRYWDGARWSDHVAPARPAARPSDQASSNLEMWGWLGAFFFPIAGFIIAIVMISKGQSQGRAAAMLAVSIVFSVAAYVVLVNNASTY